LLKALPWYVHLFMPKNMWHIDILIILKLQNTNLGIGLLCYI
jgi:hypothetical protein